MKHNNTRLSVFIGYEKAALVLMDNNKTIECASEMIRHEGTDADIVYALKGLLRKTEIKERNVGLMLPDSEVVMLNRLTLAPMTMDEVYMNLPYEFRVFIPMEKADTYEFDFRIHDISLTPKGNVDSYEISAAAVRKEILARYAEITKLAGLNMVKAFPESMCYGKLVEKHFANNEAKNKRTAVISMSSRETVLMIFKYSFLEFSRRIDRGTANKNDDFKMTDDLLAFEIQQTMEHYFNLNPEAHVPSVYFSGNIEDMCDFKEKFEERCPEYVTHTISEMIDDDISEEAKNIFAPLIGAGLVNWQKK